MGVTLGKKVLRKGRISLYIDYCYQRKRKKQYLGIILERPDNQEIRQENQRKMLLAKRIKAQEELEFLSSIFDLKSPKEEFKDMLSKQTTTLQTDFFLLMKEYLERYDKKDKKMVAACLSHLQQFHQDKILPTSLLNKDFCIHFLIYLRKRLKGNTPVGYFKKFRMCIEKCIEDGKNGF